MEMRDLRTRRSINDQREEPPSDAYEFCLRCGDFAFEFCSIHGGLLVVPDDKIPECTEYSDVPRAVLTIPEVFLYIDSSSIPGAGAGVFAKRTLPLGVRFGPYRGQRTENAATDYCWQILNSSGGASHVVDASDTGSSNWMRYVNCARHSSEQNLVAYQYHGQIYYRTTKIIRQGSELLVFYGCEFAVQLNIHLGRYNKNATQLSHQPDKSLQNPDLETQDTPIDRADALKHYSAELKKMNAYVMGVINLDKYFNKELKSPTDDPENIQFLSIFEDVDVDRRNKQIDNLQWNQVESSTIEEQYSASNGANHQGQILDITNNETLELTDASNNEPVNFNNEDQNVVDTTELIKSQGKDVDQDITTSPLICRVCSKVFNNKVRLQEHVRIHGGTQNFHCISCNYKTNVKHYFRRHEREKHNKFFSENEYETAEQSEIKKPWQCKECQISFISRSQLRDHRRIHGSQGLNHSTNDRTGLICNLEKPIENMSNKHQDKTRSFRCNFSCRKADVFANHQDLHENVNAIRCQLCDYLCISQKYLHAHWQRVHNVPTKLYQCAFCVSVFNCAEYLRKHNRRVHFGKKH